MSVANGWLSTDQDEGEGSILAKKKKRPRAWSFEDEEKDDVIPWMGSRQCYTVPKKRTLRTIKLSSSSEHSEASYRLTSGLGNDPTITSASVLTFGHQ